MALKLIEGFDHLGASQLSAKGWVATTGSGMTASVTTGRINGSCARLQASFGGVDGAFTKTLAAATATTFVFGFAFRFDTAPFSGTNSMICVARNSTTLTARVHLASDGKLSVRNSSGTVIATGTTALNASTWYYVELKIFANGASGTCELHLNGAAEIASTTGNFGSVGIDNLQLWSEDSASIAPHIFDYDDVYLLDNSGSDNTSFLGDVHVETIYPATDGANDSWTPDTGTNSADRVDDATPDDDSSYISSSTVGQKTTFDMATLAVLSGTVYAVQTNLYARKDDAATRQIAPVVRQGGSDFDGTTVTLSVSYANYAQIYENDPSDSADWTVGKVNSAEFGAKVIA